MAELAELSLVRNYAPTWGVPDGLVELWQNCRDAHMRGYVMEVMRRGESVFFRNFGAHLPRESMLIGFTTKTNDDEALGQFGEGYKMAALVLTRNGRTMMIRAGNETWGSRFVNSSTFHTEVLAFEISRASRTFDGVEVRVDGVTNEDYEEFCDRILFLSRGRTPLEKDKLLVNQAFATPAHKGRVYVGGIKVLELADAALAYNLSPSKVEISRDRKHLDVTDMMNAIAEALVDAATNGMADEVIRAVATPGTVEARALSHLPYKRQDIILDAWAAKHEGLIPVGYQSGLEDAQHVHLRARLTATGLAEAYRRKYGDVIEQAVTASKRTPRNTYPWPVSGVLHRDLQILRQVFPELHEWRVRFADFRTTKITGSAVDADKTIYVRRDQPLTEQRLTLVHEFAHARRAYQLANDLANYDSFTTTLETLAVGVLDRVELAP